MHGYLVQENSQFLSDGFSWQVASELGSDDSGFSVGADDLSPDGSISGIVSLVLGLADENHLLSQVPSGASQVGAAFDVDEGLVGGLVQSRSSVSGKHCGLVQSICKHSLFIFISNSLSFCQ